MLTVAMRLACTRRRTRRGTPRAQQMPLCATAYSAVVSDALAMTSTDGRHGLTRRIILPQLVRSACPQFDVRTGPGHQGLSLAKIAMAARRAHCRFYFDVDIILRCISNQLGGSMHSRLLGKARTNDLAQTQPPLAIVRLLTLRL